MVAQHPISRDETLKQRMLSYEELADTKFPRKLPIIISLNGRSFKKITSYLEKPYSEQFIQIIGETLIKLISEIDGAILIYSFNDEIIIIVRNDQNTQTEAWYNNQIQKIISTTASIASISFKTSADKHNIKLLGEPVFIAKSFILPNMLEVQNYLIYKQNQASQAAINSACFYELLKLYNSDTVSRKIKDKTIDEKYDILFRECNIELNSYNLAYWRGMAVYRIEKIIETNAGKEIKKKIVINTELPFFSKDKILLNHILK